VTCGEFCEHDNKPLGPVWTVGNISAGSATLLHGFSKVIIKVKETRMKLHRITPV
jgi:hypothetical protein